MITKALVPDHFDQEYLVRLLEGITKKYEREHTQLKATRQKLRQVQNRLIGMKGIVEYQRERIIQLYSLKTAGNLTKSDWTIGN